MGLYYNECPYCGTPISYIQSMCDSCSSKAIITPEVIKSRHDWLKKAVAASRPMFEKAIKEAVKFQEDLARAELLREPIVSKPEENSMSKKLTEKEALELGILLWDDMAEHGYFDKWQSKYYSKVENLFNCCPQCEYYIEQNNGRCKKCPLTDCDMSNSEWRSFNRSFNKDDRKAAAKQIADTLRAALDERYPSIKYRDCQDCKGRGWTSWYAGDALPCPKCDGRGVIAVATENMREEKRTTDTRNIRVNCRCSTPNPTIIGPDSPDAVTAMMNVANTVTGSYLDTQLKDKDVLRSGSLDELKERQILLQHAGITVKHEIHKQEEKAKPVMSIVSSMSGDTLYVYINHEKAHQRLFMTLEYTGRLKVHMKEALPMYELWKKAGCKIDTAKVLRKGWLYKLATSNDGKVFLKSKEELDTYGSFKAIYNFEGYACTKCPDPNIIKTSWNNRPVVF